METETNRCLTSQEDFLGRDRPRGDSESIVRTGGKPIRRGGMLEWVPAQGGQTKQPWQDTYIACSRLVRLAVQVVDGQEELLVHHKRP